MILDAAATRGIGSEDCEKRIVPMREGEPRRVIGYGSSRTGKHHYPTGLQWRLTIPEDKAMLALFFRWRYPSGDEEPVDRGYKVFLRRGAPIEISWLDEEDLADDLDAYTATADLEVPGSPELVEFPPESTEPLQPGEEIYVLIASATKESIFSLEAVHYLYENISSPPLPHDFDGGISASGESSYSAGGGMCFAAHPGRTGYLRHRHPFIGLLRFLIDPP